MSELKNIYDALAKAQGQIQSAKKTSQNPAFKKDGKNSTYADIAEVIDVIQKPAADNGLSVIFDFSLNGETLYINYIIMHSSGEKIVGSPVPMFLREKTVHGFGSSNTFMRRQLLKAIYQIPEEDDDGNDASNRLPPQRPPPTPPRPAVAILKNEAPKLSTNPQSFPPPAKYNAETYFQPEPPPEEDEIQHPPLEDHSLSDQIVILKERLGLDNKAMAEIVMRLTGRNTRGECDETQLTSVVNYLKMKLK